ncbi:MAG: hypothetical protein OIF58_07830 [Cohaesibacter sp.]|nr:hypothetical protein [Cohaesibacter sp.]
MDIKKISATTQADDLDTPQGPQHFDPEQPHCNESNEVLASDGDPVCSDAFCGPQNGSVKMKEMVCRSSGASPVAVQEVNPKS